MIRCSAIPTSRTLRVNLSSEFLVFLLSPVDTIGSPNYADGLKDWDLGSEADQNRNLELYKRGPDE